MRTSVATAAQRRWWPTQVGDSTRYTELGQGDGEEAKFRDTADKLDLNPA